MKIHYITPFSIVKNIGKEYNERISELPEDCWVCLRDGDTLFLTSNWGQQIHDIVTKHGHEFGLITCVTNRIAVDDMLVPDMFSVDSITAHVNKANELQELNGSDIKPFGIAPGLFMLFPKSLWNKVKFTENSIVFDKQFSGEALRHGYKIGIAKGLYILHLYRWGQESPKHYINHLL